MRITLDRNETALIEVAAIQRAAQKEARHKNMTMKEFLEIHECTSVSWYDGLFTIEFTRRNIKDVLAMEKHKERCNLAVSNKLTKR